MFTRSPTIQIGKLFIKTLGDPHLGRLFVNNVPLSRRGEREQSVWAQFKQELDDVEGCQIHVNMGDIFDKFVVSPETVLRAAEYYRRAAIENPGIDYVVLRGNHDGSRDADRASSFDIFAELVKDVTNIKVVINDPFQTNLPSYEQVWLAFVPWHPFRTGKQQVEMLNRPRYGAIFGHWDIDSFSNTPPHNLVPLDELLALTDTIVTGHVHKPLVRKYDRGQLIVTGSMQPYAFGEELEDEMYATIQLSDYLADPDLYRHMNLRIIVGKDEVVPDDIDCLQIQLIKSESADEKIDLSEVKLEDFDLKKLFENAMKEAGVGEDIMKETWDLYESMKEVE